MVVVDVCVVVVGVVGVVCVVDSVVVDSVVVGDVVYNVTVVLTANKCFTSFLEATSDQSC